MVRIIQTARLYLALLCGLAMMLTTATQAQAYYITGNYWAVTAVPAIFDNSFMSSGSGWTNSGNQALLDWNYVGGQQFVYSGGPNLITIGNLGCGPQHALGGTNGPPGPPGGQLITHFTLTINVACADNWYDGTQAPTIPSNYYSLASILRHELGHVLGICHQPASIYNLMQNIGFFTGAVWNIDGDAQQADLLIYTGHAAYPPQAGCP